jgi:ABC-type bacteriocin/lantibiotic exporter with double-glycine peptidase domain
LILFKNLKISNLKVRINDDKFLIVKDFEVKFGDCVGIKGVSGSGKTSLIESMMNLRSYESGVIKVNGEVINPEFITKGLFYYLTQESKVIADTILFNVCGTNNLNEVDIPRLKDALQHTGLDLLIKEKNIDLSYFIDESGGNLSGGQRQRLVLTRAIYSNSPIIVLDESTSALDKESERDMSKYIANSKGVKTFIVISHSDEFLEICDKIYNINGNQLVIV